MCFCVSIYYTYSIGVIPSYEPGNVKVSIRLSVNYFFFLLLCLEAERFSIDHLLTVNYLFHLCLLWTIVLIVNSCPFSCRIFSSNCCRTLLRIWLRLTFFIISFIMFSVLQNMRMSSANYCIHIQNLSF